MIVLITARDHGYTVRSLVSRSVGVPTPTFRSGHYDQLFGARSARVRRISSVT